jgi:quinol monooxygenase YgiN
MSDNIDVFASFFPKDGSASQVKDILIGMIDPTRNEEGCLKYDFYQSGTEKISYHLIETYKGPTALAAHRETKHYKVYRSAIESFLEKPIAVTVMQAINIKS